MPKSTNSQNRKSNKVAELEVKVDKVMKDVEDLIKKAKTKYHEMDPATKKKIAIGIAGLGALIAGAAIIKKKKN